VATSQLYEYPKREQAIFYACMSATGNGLLISECQDFISSLRRCGYVLRPLKKRRAAKPASNKQSKPLLFNCPPLCTKCQRIHKVSEPCEV
jgi:hypothetical protein